MNMINIVFLGAPGSGKGTQSALLSSDLDIPTISTGEILRKEVSDKSPIGNLAKSYMDAGGLVPDNIVVDIIKKRISESGCSKGFILDGFPRSVNQAAILDEMLASSQKEINVVINIEVNDDVLIKRISGRFACQKCGTTYNRFLNPTKAKDVCDKCGGNDFGGRIDDNTETVKNRLKVYNQNNRELMEFYRKKDLLYSVDGLKNTTLVNSDIREVCQSRVNF